MENNIEDSFKNIIDILLKKAEQEGFDDYWFYSTLLDGEEMMKLFFEEYFKKKEGISCCVDKAIFTVKGIKRMIQTKQNIKLKATYREFQEKGGDIGAIKNLDNICYWCPKTIEDTKQAIKIYMKETIEKWSKD